MRVLLHDFWITQLMKPRYLKILLLNVKHFCDNLKVCFWKSVNLKWIISRNPDLLVIDFNKGKKVLIIQPCDCSYCTPNICKAAAVKVLELASCCRWCPSSGLPALAGLPSAADVFIHMAGHPAEEREALQQGRGVCDHGDADRS